jgi:hypothetical protein
LETDEQNMFKIKYPMFLMLQRLKNLSKSGLIDAVRNMDVQDIINGAHVDITASIPDGYLESASSFIDDVVAQADDRYLNPIRSLVSSVEAIFEDISGDYDLTSREGVKGYVFRVQGMDIDKDQKSLLLKMKSLDERPQRINAVTDMARNLVIKNNK